MATHKLGKLKINTSKEGLAFRFGDGKIHRLGLGKRAKDAEPDYNEEEYVGGEDYEGEDYAPEEDFAPNGYTGRFAQSAGRNDDYADDYADGGYADDDEFDGYANDDGYAHDDGYADDGRIDDRYADDDRYDDGYDRDGNYADEDFADGDGGYYDDDFDGEGEAYDDRYLDEDADEPYADEPYADESPLMRYVDENDWVTYLLLVLLPPLGIYLLWRRRRFETPIRWAVSGVSGVWFVILMVLLISAILSGGGDVTTNPPITMTTPTPTVAVEATPNPSASAGADLGDLTAGGDEGDGISGSGVAPSQTQDALAIDATATPIASFNSNTGAAVSQNTVIMTNTGAYYHNNASCANIEEGAAVSNVTKEMAEQRGKVACPICYPDQKTFYSTATGKYYHTDINCSNMKDATAITEDAAKEKGQTPCPVCVTKQVNSLSNTGLKFATSSTTDKSGVTVYATAGGRYFHTKADCSGMTNATSGSLLQAMLAGKTACPTCAKSAGSMVYCTRNGTYYHNKSDCSGMQDAFQVTLAESMILGKKKCPKCWGSSAVGSATSAGNASTGTTGDVYVYATKGGTYYHTEEHCSGMTGASRVTLKSAIASGKPACPKCCASANKVVYATQNGQYYHSYASCSGMTNAQAGTLAQALALGKKRCPNCWASGDGGTTASGGAGSTASGSYVYCTQSGTYYHTKSNCSGMTGASRVSISTAVSAGKRACPTCASAASKMVYSTDGGTYYHSKSNCSGMSGAKQRTLESALMLGQKSCPVCIGSASSGSGSGVTNVTSGKFSSASGSAPQTNLISSGRYTAGTSGIKVYATASGKHYHTTSSCSGMKDPAYITLETALNYGKTACPKCASSASTTVYAVKGGKYYHYSKTCAGAGAVKGYRASGLALGLDPCPVCVTKTQAITSSGTYKAGTSGVKVYASVTGKYYHASKSCAGSNASKITLETALNYGKSACPSCAGSASKTVYSSGNDKYYHTSKTHAGAGAVAGTFAKALAMGKKECPVCIGGSESYEISDIKYSAPGDTKVYVDLDSDMLYYHKNSRCGDAGMSGGTGVTLDFVTSWGYKACPFCNPPTSVE